MKKAYTTTSDLPGSFTRGKEYVWIVIEVFTALDLNPEIDKVGTRMT